MKRFIFLLSLMGFLGSPSLHAFQQEVIQANGLEFWTETFGKKEDPALLLIMGAGGQGIFWPQAFCENLAGKGFFVIRYDHRDTGLSSFIDYKQTPYTLLDMVKDDVAILDHYRIQKAHIVGISMGGEIATLFAAHYPERIKTVTLMATTPDMSVAFNTLQEKPVASPLSKPTQAVIDNVKSIMTPPTTLEGKLQVFIESARVNNGTAVPIDEPMMRQLALQSLVRMRGSDAAGNHFQAIQASYDLHQAAFSKVKAPTLIIHGDSDPVFPIDHAHALKKAIPQSKLAVIPGMGHGFANTQFYRPLIDKIVEIISSAKT